MALGLGVVFLTIIYAVLTIANNEAYQQQLYATRLGMDLQSIQAYGKDINADRTIEDAGAFHIVFQNTEVALKERGVPTATFLTTQDPSLVFSGGEFQPEEKTIGPLTIFKRGKRYGVAKPPDVPSKYLLYCDSEKGQPLKKIALDPGEGYDDANSKGTTGYILESPGMRESRYTLRLANAIRAGRTIYNPTRLIEEDSHASIQDRQETEGDALVSLHVGYRNDNRDVAKAYFTTQESKRLGCEILNQIALEFDIPVRLIPVNPGHLSKDDPRQVLTGRRLAVLLEIGNAQKSDSILEQDKQLAVTINKGIEQYGTN
jgi:hypothetical protein